MESAATYRAVQAVSPGQLELTQKPLRDPGPGKVLIRVEACGVCHSDAATVEGLFPVVWPRVPGHEVVGRIDALVSRAGLSVSASVLDSWAARAATASSAAPAISSTA
jgi:D-arabinose 1-dehydrogenase-like Zn-dependent alcohol dehydrogenase